MSLNKFTSENTGLKAELKIGCLSLDTKTLTCDDIKNTGTFSGDSFTGSSLNISDSVVLRGNTFPSNITTPGFVLKNVDGKGQIDWGVDLNVLSGIAFSGTTVAVGDIPVFQSTDGLSQDTSGIQLSTITTDISDLKNDKLDKAGGTMTGNLNMNSNDIQNIATITGDLQVNDKLSVGGIDVLSEVLTLRGTNPSTSSYKTDYSTIYPLHQISIQGPDNIYENYGCFYNGTNFISSDAGSNFQIQKVNDIFSICYGIASVGGISGIDNQEGFSMTNQGVCNFFQNLNCNEGIRRCGVDDTSINIGVGSSSFISTGIRNTIVGSTSGVLLSTGNDNTVLGNGTLKSANSSNNTAIGSDSLEDVSSGSNNTGLGFFSGDSLTTGSNNVFLGANSSTTKVDVQNSIALGSNVVVTADNQCVIGDSSLTEIKTGGTNTNLIISGDVLASNGSVSAPSYSFSNDTNTGMYRFGANRIGITCNGVLSFYIEENYNVTHGQSAYASGAYFRGRDQNTLGSSSTYAHLPSRGNRLYFTNQTNTGFIDIYANSFIPTSDERLKKDIKDATLGLEFVSKLKPKTYRMKDGNQELKYGFLAQDIKKVCKENKYDFKGVIAFMGEDDKDKTENERLLGMDYIQLIPVLVKAVQELSTRVEALEAKI